MGGVVAWWRWCGGGGGVVVWGVVWCGCVWCVSVLSVVLWSGGSDLCLNSDEFVLATARLQPDYGCHVPVDMTPSALCLCTGPQKV